MKSLAELNALKDEVKDSVFLKNEGNGVRIIVGMATCGIAAGAKPVLAALEEAAKSSKIAGIAVKQAGCIGICQYEPVIEIVEGGKEKVTYVKVDALKAKEIFNSHIINGKIIPEYTIGSVTANNLISEKKT